MSMVTGIKINKFTPRRILGMTDARMASRGTPLCLWANAKRAGVTTDGAVVSTLKDGSGDGNDLIQGTADKKPALKLNILNGRPVVRFDGIDDYLKTAVMSAVNTQPITLFLLFAIRTFTSWRKIFDGYNADTLVAQMGGSSPNISVYAGADLSTNALAVNTFGILEIQYNETDSFIQVNGGTKATGNVGSGSHYLFTLGAKGDNTNPSAIDVAELLVYIGAMKDVQRSQVRKYLREKWRIAGITV